MVAINFSSQFADAVAAGNETNSFTGYIIRWRLAATADLSTAVAPGQDGTP
jgi:hypothetical protein